MRAALDRLSHNVSGCRTRSRGAAFAPLLLSKCRDRARVRRKERSDWSRQPGVIRSGSFPGALPRRQSPLLFCRWPTYYSMNAGPPYSPPTTTRNPRNSSSPSFDGYNLSMDTYHLLQIQLGVGAFISTRRRWVPPILDRRTKKSCHVSALHDLRILSAHAPRSNLRARHRSDSFLILSRTPCIPQNKDHRASSGGRGALPECLFCPASDTNWSFGE